MKIKKIEGDFAYVETGQLIRKVNIQMVSRVCVGDYAIVHAGFAIEKLDPKKAKETLRLVDEIH
jgi:hydrogenase expression/formation protein HypC